MKKLYTTLVAVLVIMQFSYGQNSPTWPSSGPVGIGTSNPGSNLEILELSESKPSGVVSPTKSVLKLSRSGTSNYSYPESAEFRIGHGGPAYWGSRLDLFVNGPSNQTNVPDQQVMTWHYNGNVGIGTASPTSKLDIYSNNERMHLGNGGGTDLFFGQWDAVNNRIESVGRSLYLTTYTGAINFGISGNTNMSISNSGNVLIGQITQNNPSYKLDVAGRARANEIVVNTTGADFVFDKNYQLLKLSDLKAYIDKNHHLPEIPSADEMKANGLELGEMNKKLLQKVEELTLYLIEKDKQAVEQQQKTKQQDARIAALEAEISKLIEVKTYMNRNQHLTDMPSEKEGSENSINLGEMVKLQTKKIEELTLYLIEKDKQMEEQQNTITQLAVRLQTLEKHSIK